MAHSKHIKGDRAELIAAEYFINLGYSVHRNMSQHGPVDLVIIDEDRTGDVILIDVKALSLRTKNGWKVNRVPTKKQQELDVQLIFVNLLFRSLTIFFDQYSASLLEISKSKLKGFSNIEFVSSNLPVLIVLTQTT